MFNELQERVEDATNLTAFVARSPVGAEGIELVEQVNRSSLADRVEYQPQLGCRFTQVFGNQAVELNAEQRKTQLTGKNGGRHRLAGTRRTDQEQTALRSQTVGLQMCALALLGQDPLDAAADGLFKRHLAQTSLRICGREQPRQLSARLHHRNGSNPLASTVLASDRLSPIDDVAKLLSELSMPLPGGLSGNLKGDGIETLFIAFGVAAD